MEDPVLVVDMKSTTYLMYLTYIEFFCCIQHSFIQITSELHFGMKFMSKLFAVILIKMFLTSMIQINVFCL